VSHSSSVVTVLAATLAMAFACSDQAPPHGAASERDSAGVAILDVVTHRVDSTRLLRLSGEPVLEIGSADEATGALVNGVTRVARLSDGRIMVVSAATQQLLFFSEGGELLRSAGGRGGGPGEFQMIVHPLVIPADTIVATDFMLNRLTVLDSSAALVKTFNIRIPDSSPRLRARLQDGSYLVETGKNAMYVSEGTGLKWDLGSLVHLDSAGNVIRQVLEWPAAETFVAGGVAGMAAMAAPFGRSNPLVIANDQIVIAMGERYELRYHDMDGTLRRIVRRSHEPRPVTDDDIAAYKARYLESARDPGAARDLLAVLEFPNTHPAFGRVEADLTGNVWVQAYRSSDATGDNVWSVFGPDGSLLTDVVTPERFRVMEIGSDYVLGVWRDDLDVEYVRMYSLIKSTSKAS
jgi:hypothetical protein